MAPQHSLVVADLALVGRIRTTEQKMVKTKWWKLKEEESKLAVKEAVSQKLEEDVSGRSCNAVAGTVRKTREKELGKTSGKRTLQDKENWWWTPEVQTKNREKKMAKKRYDETGMEKDQEQYRIAKKNAKRAVAVAKAKSRQKFHEDLETKERREIGLLKTWTNREEFCVTSRILRSYFETLLNVENPRQIVDYGQRVMWT